VVRLARTVTGRGGLPSAPTGFRESATSLEHIGKAPSQGRRRTIHHLALTGRWSQLTPTTHCMRSLCRPPSTLRLRRQASMPWCEGPRVKTLVHVRFRLHVDRAVMLRLGYACHSSFPTGPVCRSWGTNCPSMSVVRGAGHARGYGVRGGYWPRHW